MSDRIEVTEEMVLRARIAIASYLGCDMIDDRVPGFTDTKLALEAALNPPSPVCKNCGKPGIEHVDMVAAPFGGTINANHGFRVCPGAFFEASE